MTTTRPIPETSEPSDIIYPSSDGQPMAESTLQYQWITKIQGGIDTLYQDDPNIFVAGDLLWYPVEGQPTICQAPDTMVVFGRPKGHRLSYLQWREDNIPPQVVFEIQSHSDTRTKLYKKLAFYTRYGVDEYYLYNPDNQDLQGWQRVEGLLEIIDPMIGWVSPRLNIRFEVTSEGLELFRPDGERFLSYLELDQQRQLFAQRAEQEAQRAEQEAQRAERLAAKLRELNIDPDQI